MARITGPYVFTLIVAMLYAGTATCLALARPAAFSAWSSAACWECAMWHAALGLGVWCYCLTVLTSPGFVDEPEVQEFLKRYGCDKTADGRQCEECEADKPPRAYHSRVHATRRTGPAGRELRGIRGDRAEVGQRGGFRSITGDSFDRVGAAGGFTDGPIVRSAKRPALLRRGEARDGHRVRQRALPAPGV